MKFRPRAAPNTSTSQTPQKFSWRILLLSDLCTESESFATQDALAHKSHFASLSQTRHRGVNKTSQSNPDVGFGSQWSTNQWKCLRDHGNSLHNSHPIVISTQSEYSLLSRTLASWSCTTRQVKGGVRQRKHSWGQWSRGVSYQLPTVFTLGNVVQSKSQRKWFEFRPRCIRSNQSANLTDWKRRTNKQEQQNFLVG